MYDLFILLAVLSVVIGVITIPIILKGGKEGQETANGAVLAVVGIVLFFAGSYLSLLQKYIQQSEYIMQFV